MIRHVFIAWNQERSSRSAKYPIIRQIEVFKCPGNKCDAPAYSLGPSYGELQLHAAENMKGPKIFQDLVS